MRNIKELKDIVLKIELIEEIKEPLQKLLDDINTLLQQGHEWINNIGNKTYQEMKELLDSEIAKFLRQCFCIASNGHEKFSETALTVEQLNQASNFVSVDVANTRSTDGKDNEHILGQIEELAANITSHAEMLQTLQHKIKNQEKKSLKSVSKLQQQTEEKCDEIMKELHEASNFMSNLSEELNQTKDEIQDKKIQEISQNVVNYLEQRESIAKEKEKVQILNKEVKRLTDELGEALEAMREKETTIIQLQDEYGFSNNKNKWLHAQAVKSLETKEAEIVKLKDEIVAANDALKKKDKEIVRAIKCEDFERCIEIAKRKERNLDDKGMDISWDYMASECRHWLSRKENIPTLYNECIGLTGVEFISWITELLNEIQLTTSECAAFWLEYKKCLNS